MNPFEVLIPVSMFAMFGWIVYIIAENARRRQQLRMTAEFHSKLLDRVGSATEFGEFLNTDGGARFLDSLSTERATGGASVRILRATQVGLVSLMLGLGVLGLLTVYFGDLPRDTAMGLLVFAAIVLSVGVGLLLSAAASWYLSKRMGILKPVDESDPGQTPAA